jgi:hypothetical protein
MIGMRIILSQSQRVFPVSPIQESDRSLKVSQPRERNILMLLMLFFLPLPSKPYDWTTDTVLLAWVGVISLVIGIFGIAISYWLFVIGKSKKQLTYEVVSDTPIVSIKQTKQGKIKVVHEDSSGHNIDLNEARIFTFRMWNSGNQEVRVWNVNDGDIEAMEIPIELSFQTRKVIALTQVQTRPERQGIILQDDLDTYINTTFKPPYHLALPRCVLGPKQSFLISAILDGPSENVAVNGRIINGKIIDNKKEEKKFYNIRVKVALAILVIAIFSLFCTLYILLRGSNYEHLVVMIFSSLLSILFVFIIQAIVDRLPLQIKRK